MDGASTRLWWVARGWPSGLLDGGSLTGALGRADAWDLVFGAGRSLHLAAVLAALALMFRPTANAYFRATAR
ncbi:hypothetical protein ACFWUQ_30855 [Streptomyces sp. NPDC058662]|uniref:hypothetical protein n=1 Tax=Streptomyces sp. NPDC058662 TaxID=3346583 RepID=UPI003658404C